MIPKQVDCYVGIDLGSTTTKAVVMDPSRRILGRGITNSRSNYKVAASVAKEAALVSARFHFLSGAINDAALELPDREAFLELLKRQFHWHQQRQMFRLLGEACRGVLREWGQTSAHAGDDPRALEDALETILSGMEPRLRDAVLEGKEAKSDFFRDLAGSLYLQGADAVARERGLSFDVLVSIFDKAILKVENTVLGDATGELLAEALEETVRQLGLESLKPRLLPLVHGVGELEFAERAMVGTGYGRMRLPFPKEMIRSEILCHGLGAHFLFPRTATVLDIGGQDTKAIQVDENGIVTSFQMNDRCAAGCGRYLGYIADEMNIGLHELGPLALQASRCVRINSTCTVFAGAELRDRLAAGERREDILAGLHRAIMLRAMSLLARSGGIRNEFTFTGGVAKNPAAVKALRQLVRENYGEVKINIHPDSIYMGAIGAALFATESNGKNLREEDAA
jgi:benzoyl-CoA reductase subunit A